MKVRFQLPADPSFPAVLTDKLTVSFCSACPKLMEISSARADRLLNPRQVHVYIFDWGFPEPSITYFHVITYHYSQLDPYLFD